MNIEIGNKITVDDLKKDIKNSIEEASYESNINSIKSSLNSISENVKSRSNIDNDLIKFIKTFVNSKITNKDYVRDFYETSHPIIKRHGRGEIDYSATKDRNAATIAALKTVMLIAGVWTLGTNAIVDWCVNTGKFNPVYYQEGSEYIAGYDNYCDINYYVNSSTAPKIYGDDGYHYEYSLGAHNDGYEHNMMTVKFTAQNQTNYPLCYTFGKLNNIIATGIVPANSSLYLGSYCQYWYDSTYYGSVITSNDVIYFNFVRKYEG
jgi:hypothetical protein